MADEKRPMRARIKALRDFPYLDCTVSRSIRAGAETEIAAEHVEGLAAAGVVEPIAQEGEMFIDPPAEGLSPAEESVPAGEASRANDAPPPEPLKAPHNSRRRG